MATEYGIERYASRIWRVADSRDETPQVLAGNLCELRVPVQVQT